MSQTDAREPSTSGKGKAFFDRADQVADTGNWDFAIQLYLEGIEREPDNLERGHKKLREVSLKRKAQGGKGPGMMEKLKRRATKDAKQNLINSEYFLAKEPGSEMFMEQVLKAAQALELKDVAKWVGNVLLESQRQAKKASKRVLVLLTDAFDDLEAYGEAMQACDMAMQLDPNDVKLSEHMRELSARYTIQKGRYDEEGDFTKSVKDMDRQKELLQKDAMVKSREFLAEQVAQTAKQYEASPKVVGKILAYIDALLAMEDEEHENRAIEVLEQAYADSGAYQHKVRVGDIRIRQMNRKRREALAAGDKQGALELAREQLQFELKEYSDRVAAYPTDLAMKFELGRRQLAAGQYDDAIGILQQAQRDPRRHVLALNCLGQAFSKKGWLREAADTYTKALESEMSEERSKEVRYNLGDVLEQMGNFAQAQDEFSQVAQLDYTFKDVRERLENIRRKIESEGDTGAKA